MGNYFLIFSDFLKWIALFGSIVLLGSKSYAQEDFESLNQWFSPPNVASFNKFEDTPVSKYTGTPDISIPLYTIKEGEIEIPIVLRYHGQGIKVEEEASWVGLGWNLNVGGSVTCRVYGKSDEVWYEEDSTLSFMEFGRSMSSQKVPQMIQCLSPYSCWPLDNVPENGIIVGEEPAEYYQTFGNDPPSSSWVYESATHRPIAMSYGYYKPDIFSFSIPGASGKFYVDHTYNTCNLISPNELFDIKTTTEHKWLITNSNGAKYFFNTPQKRHSDFGDPLERDLPITYFLDSILYQNKQVAEFYYTEKQLINTNNSYKGNTYIKMNGTNTSGEYFCLPTGLAEKTEQFIGEKYYPKYLSKIITKNHIVEFVLSGSEREDIPGEYSLDSILIKNKDNNIVKAITFDYGYFDDNIVGDARDYKRLKLLNVSDGSNVGYTFQYNPSINLPSKKSFARDYWGYYNGNDNANTLLPDLEKFYRYNDKQYWVDDLTTSEVPKANRGADSVSMKAACLYKIIYPTGGYTVFDFEPHTFSNYYIEKRNAETISRAANCNTNEYDEETFSVDESISTTVNYSWGIAPLNQNEIQDPSILINIMNGCYVEFYENNLLKYQSTSDLSSSSKSGFFTYSFSPGNTYKLVAHITQAAITHGYSGVNINLSYTKKDLWSIGGGLRIAEIKNFDLDNRLIKDVVYKYEDQGFSYGKLMSQLKFDNLYNLTCKAKEGGAIGWKFVYYKYAQISTGSNICISNSASGQSVGYSKVIEKISGNKDVGYTEYNFSNTASIPIDVTGIEIPNIRNGLVNSIFRFSDKGIISSEKYTYSEVLKNNYFGFFAPRSQFMNNCFYNSSFSVFTYPIPCSTFKLSGEINTQYIYQNNQLTDSIKNITQYNYSQSNLSLNAEEKQDSDGKIRLVKMIYPGDIDSSIYKLMTFNHILNPVIEKTTYIDGKVVNSTLTSYKSNDGSYVPAEISALKIENPLETFSEFNGGNKDSNYDAEAEVIYNEYDEIGNPLRITSKKGGTTMYLWAYNDQYPVCKIESNINQAISISVDDNSLSDSDDLDDIMNDVAYLQNLLSSYSNNTNYQISLYTYKPLVGMTSQTDPSGRTIYYEYDDFGRLKYTRNQDGEIINKYDYHYANE